MATKTRFYDVKMNCDEAMYIDKGQERCPFCYSSETRGTSLITFGKDYANRSVHKEIYECKKCHKRYVLHSVEIFVTYKATRLPKNVSCFKNICDKEGDSHSDI